MLNAMETCLSLPDIIFPSKGQASVFSVYNIDILIPWALGLSYWFYV